jgi:hypothetical protein
MPVKPPYTWLSWWDAQRKVPQVCRELWPGWPEPSEQEISQWIADSMRQKLVPHRNGRAYDYLDYGLSYDLSYGLSYELLGKPTIQVDEVIAGLRSLHIRSRETKAEYEVDTWCGGGGFGRFQTQPRMIRAQRTAAILGAEIPLEPLTAYFISFASPRGFKPNPDPDPDLAEIDSTVDQRQPRKYGLYKPYLKDLMERNSTLFRNKTTLEIRGRFLYYCETKKRDLLRYLPNRRDKIDRIIDKIREELGWK